MVTTYDESQIRIHRKNENGIDHIFIACLECRFKGSWVNESQWSYKAVGEYPELHLVELNGTRKYIKFKIGASVTILPSNVVTYEADDEIESVYVNEDMKGKSKTG